MSNIALERDIGAYIKSAVLHKSASITAGAGNDGVAVAGEVIDMQPGSTLFPTTIPRSLKVMVHYNSTLNASETMALTVLLEHSPDNSTWSTYQTMAAADTATSTVVDTAPDGILEVDYNLETAARYLRVTLTADLSRANTDTVIIGVVGAFGGTDRKPA